MHPFKRQSAVIIVLIGVLAALAITQAMRGPDDALWFDVEGDTAYGYGTTYSSSLSDFQSFLRKNPDVKTLVLKDMPGTVDSQTNISIARLIRREGLSTHLERDSEIASGAVDLFIAGKERTMECGARIGVHSWSISNEGAMIETPAIHPRNLGVDRFQRFHERFLIDMGVDPAFYVFTRDSAAPDQIYVLKEDEIERFGLLTSGGCE